MDTHVLADGLMPQATWVDGPGWSPSGKWFAWTATNDQYGSEKGATWQQSFLISSDGLQRVPLLEKLYVTQMTWAPHDDLLLVLAQLPGQTTLMLLNPGAKKQVLSSHRLNANNADSRETTGSPTSTWIGNHYIVQVPGASVIFVGDTQGRLTQKPLAGGIPRL